MWHDQLLEGKISCTTKSMKSDNRSFMTGGTTMNDWRYDQFADGTTYLRVRIAVEKFWTFSKTLPRPILLLRSSATSKTTRALFLRFKYDSHHFGSYIGCNLVVSLVWLTPNMFHNLVATDFARTIVYDLCDYSCAVSVIDVQFSQIWIVSWL